MYIAGNEKLNSIGHVTFLAPLPYFPDAPRTSLSHATDVRCAMCDVRCSL